jgi:AraC family transcriptional regulator
MTELANNAARDAYVNLYSEGRYAPYVREARVAGSAPVQLRDIRQPAGDWSHPPLDVLVIIETTSHGMQAHCDLGAGQFSARPTKGSFALVAPDTASTIVIDNEHSVHGHEIPAAYLTPLLAEVRPPENLFDFGPLHTNFFQSKSLGPLFSRMWRSAAADLPVSRLAVDGAVLTLLSELLTLAERSTLTERGGLAPWQIRWVVEHLHAHLAEDISLARLAALVGLSANHFCTAFKSSMGEPPHRYLVRLRIERAKELLVAQRTPITEVALAVGFGSSAHFSTVFRKHVGVAPTVWRRERMG